MNPTRHRRPPSRRLLGAMVLALLLAQWVALAHAVAHAPWLTGAAVSVSAVTGAVSAGVRTGAGAGATVSAGVSERDSGWGHAAGAPACRLLDQIVVGQATAGEPPALAPVSFAAEPPAALQPPAVCRPSLRAFDARGPPQG